MKTAVASPEPDRPRNEPVTWTTGTTTTNTAVTAGWIRLDIKR